MGELYKNIQVIIRGLWESQLLNIFILQISCSNFIEKAVKNRLKTGNSVMIIRHLC